ncbi:four-carbon acid sugar kinase family protein [Arundinibacter roseus]|uniref:Four-carbon acid sugar kinase family protein n=1 Tax=Arundinibacter roseus TaxID=2070510 RepID=A0A4R4K5G3_9BACT|nr:four-carbon acid sugar kinase family protein [Arundinibacter roseus]TDB62724.1 four-carbon acid sugar kinase family protein [Arundinibacter roseus]
MIIVIADDFSGAAEIAGIGNACGMDTLLVNNLPVKKVPKLLVIDSATRSLTEWEAHQKIQVICQKIDQLGNKPYRLFKKVDSLLRGHIRAELRAIKQHFGFKRVILLPANPSRNRTIQDGFLKIDGRFLHQTALALDPEFPRQSSHVYDLLHHPGHTEQHRHFYTHTQTENLSGLLTADVRTREDLDYYLHSSGKEVLLAGGAEFFESFLMAEGFPRTSLMDTIVFQKKNLFINGSTYVHQSFEEMFPDIPVTFIQAFGPSLTFDSTVLDQIELVNLDLNIRNTALLGLAPTDDIKEGQAYRALYFLAEFVQRVIEKHYFKNLNLFITGGSTASCLFHHLAIHQFTITGELSEGVVVVQPVDYPFLRVIVKPGSYAWPATLKLTFSEQQL